MEDCAAIEEIFAQLGYGPVFKYEKFRTEWETAEGHLLLIRRGQEPYRGKLAV